MSDQSVKNKLIALVDGGCTNNGSYFAKAFFSYCVFKVDNSELHPPLETLRDPILSNLKATIHKIGNSSVTTNNVAEAVGMYSLLNDMIRSNILNPRNYIIIYSDSKLVINQVKKLYKINNTQLKEIYRWIDQLVENYKESWGHAIWVDCSVKHISGELMKKTLIGH